MRNIAGLTGPERAIDGERTRDIKAVISDAGGCKFCIHRVKGGEGLGIAACDTLGREFPKCKRTPGRKFTLDPLAEPEVESLAHRERSRRRAFDYLVSLYGVEAASEMVRKAREARHASG